MKYLIIFGIMCAVVLTYVLMIAQQPAINEIIATANASTGNWTATPEFGMAQGVMNSFPLWQWGIPALVGLIWIVITLRGK
jgi:hypothetical protein